MPRETLVAIAQKRAAPLDAIAFGPLAPKWSGVLASLSTTTGGRFLLVDSAPKLADALRDGLGTKQPAAYSVKFDYDTVGGTAAAAPASAVLEYASPGHAVTLIPIDTALAALRGEAARRSERAGARSRHPLRALRPSRRTRSRGSMHRSRSSTSTST